MAIDVSEMPMAPAPVESPLGTSINGGLLPEQNKPRLEIYQGKLNKTEVLNNGENGQDRAVKFQLKEGTQGLTFVMGMDSDDPKRVLNLETLDKVSEMTNEQFAHTAILQQQDNNLSVLTPDNQDVRLTKAGLEHQPYKIRLNPQTVVEILNFDPEDSSIVLHKVNNDMLLVPPLPVPVPIPALPGWRQRLVDLIGPAIIATSIGVSGGPPIEATPVSLPPVERRVETQIPETLQCPATKEMTVASGDSLTKLIIDVNGLPRYLTPEGKLDTQKLYKDLACLLVVPENRPRIRENDEIVASAMDTMFQNRTLIGPVTAERIYEVLNALNTVGGQDRFPGASEQLVVIQPGQRLMVPDFRTQEAPKSMQQGSIPVPDLRNIAR